jgi:hypothetical protein
MFESFSPIGDDRPPPPPAAGPAAPAASLEVRLLVGIWLPRLNGDASLGPTGSPELDLSRQLNLDDREPTPSLELTIRKKEIWELIFSGFSFSTEASGTFSGRGTWGSIVLSDGDPFQNSFDMTSVAAEVAVAVWRPYADGAPRAEGTDNRTSDGRYAVDLRFSPTFGMRYLDVTHSLSSGGTTETAGGEWLAVMVGLDAALEYRPDGRVPLLDTFGMQAGVSLGPALGGDGGTAWQVRGGFTVQFTEHVGVLVGYRLVEMSVENDDYSVTGGLQGLFFAGSIRF